MSGVGSSLALWQYVQLWIRIRNVHLLMESDRLIWRWMTNDQYSSKSCYNALFREACLKLLEAELEVVGVPRVNTFVWLACLDRCWTGE
jgi:hypothetical protein